MQKNTCQWKLSTEEWDDEIYETSCGECFMLNNPATLAQNNFKYCPSCGKEIEEIKK
jgi:uncharacterized paraquat-inducible protein A